MERRGRKRREGREREKEREESEGKDDSWSLGGIDASGNHCRIIVELHDLLNCKNFYVTACILTELSDIEREHSA